MLKILRVVVSWIEQKNTLNHFFSGLQLSSNTGITVELSDVNDNEPVLTLFSERNCFFSVTELTQGVSCEL